MPERVLRSATAVAGGLLREVGHVALPSWLRRTRLYRSLVESTLRFLVEQVGQVEGTYPEEEKLAENFLLRRSAGNGIELIGILTFRASPVWVMAALADISGAGSQLIREITSTLKREGLLAPDETFETVEQMLDGLERSAGRIAEAVNTPPLDIASLRQEWADIGAEISRIPAPNLPSADSVWQTWRELEAEAAAQKRTVFELSSLMALASMRQLPDNLRWLGKSAAVAARTTGSVFAGGLLNHYRETLGEIHRTGYFRYWMNEFRPYLRAAAQQFSPKRKTLTDRLFRGGASVLICVGLLDAADRKPVSPSLTARSAAAARVQASALRAHVSFLASDALEGRATPSKGLEVASEYIASQFRRAGLEPVSGDSYFQEAEWTLEIGGIAIARESVKGGAGIPLMSRRPVVKVETADALPAKLPAGAVVLTSAASFPAIREKLASGRLPVFFVQGELPDPPAGVLVIEGPALEQLAALPAQSRVTYIPATAEAKMRNVIGILRGSDTKLKETFLLVTAHYDHVGVRPGGESDRIHNGANDNASSVAGIIEAASAIAAGRRKPRRSIVFMTYFGEELGLIGSRYYADHPVLPIAKTIAQLNLEQLGRTDDSEGARIASATVTGFDYSSLTAVLQKAGLEERVKIWKHEKNSDAFFNYSDNEALANKGVPAHTLGVTFNFPDYHKPGDEWQKIDYDNFAKITRLVTRGVFLAADGTAAPLWNKNNPTAAKYASLAP